jgi:hypothetical protein
MRMRSWWLAMMLGAAMSAAAQSDGFVFQPLSSGKATPGTQRDNHASTLVELKGGDVMAAWFAGTKEGAPDVAIYGAWLHDGAWSACERVGAGRQGGLLESGVVPYERRTVVALLQIWDEAEHMDGCAQVER